MSRLSWHRALTMTQDVGDNTFHNADNCDCVRCNPELRRTVAEQAPEKSCEWAVVNCHVLARRELHRLREQIVTPSASRDLAIERWEHVLRICELAGAKSAGVLRAAIPTEITDGELHDAVRDRDRRMQKSRVAR